VDIAIPIYDRFTALDAIGPYEVLSRVPGAKVTFLAEAPGPVQTETEMLSIVAEASYADLPSPDVIVVPGGLGNRELLEASGLVDWIRAAHETTTWTTSVCTGSLLLAAAGVLDGVDATTHWLARDELHRLGAVPVGERVVERGKVITAAGVSAGIDMALVLVARMTNDELAQAIQLGIEYDPEPPFSSGSPDKAPAEIVELVTAHSAQLA
jgi:transcriptional regulator GlxA family with amidase domain